MRGIETDGARIRNLRKARGWTQEELAAAVPCSVRTVRNAEQSQRIDPATLSQISNALKVRLVEVSATDMVSHDQIERNKQIEFDEIRCGVVRQWLEAYCKQDVPRLLSLFTSDIVIEIPGSKDLPGGGVHHGIAEVRTHLEASFAHFQTLPVASDDYDLHSSGDRVFYRSWASAVSRTTGDTFTAHVTHEFQFVDEKILRIVTVFDTAAMRRTLDGEG